MTDNPNDRIDGKFEESFKDQVAREREQAEAAEKAAEARAQKGATAYAKTCEVLGDFAKLQGDVKSLVDQTEFKKRLLDVLSDVLSSAVEEMDSINSDITLAKTPLGRNAAGATVFEEVRALKLVFNSTTVEFQIKMNQPVVPRKAGPRGPTIAR